VATTPALVTSFAVKAHSLRRMDASTRAPSSASGSLAGRAVRPIVRDDCVGAADQRHVGAVGDGHGKIADREDSVDRSGSTTGGDEAVELREARKRIKLLDQEAEVMTRCRLFAPGRQSE
jgi:hypothetical protein